MQVFALYPSLPFSVLCSPALEIPVRNVVASNLQTAAIDNEGASVGISRREAVGSMPLGRIVI
jgi:hypothetical protein